MERLRFLDRKLRGLIRGGRLAVSLPRSHRDTDAGVIRRKHNVPGRGGGVRRGRGERVEEVNLCGENVDCEARQALVAAVMGAEKLLESVMVKEQRGKIGVGMEKKGMSWK